MTSHCDTFNEQLAAECGGQRPWSAPLEAHLSECPQCARTARRLGHEVELLRALEPQGAPADLLGRVVATLNGGHREDRAVAGLQSVERPTAPAELDGRLESLLSELREEGRLGPLEAPQALTDRVREDLGDLPAAVASRQLRRLSHLAAPEELADRTREGLRPRKPVLLVPAGAGLAAAAAAVLLFGLIGPDSTTEPAAGAENELALDFRVERASTLEALSPSAQDLYERLTGGPAPAGGESALGVPRRPAQRATGGPGRTALPVRTAPSSRTTSAAGGGSQAMSGGNPGTSAGGSQAGVTGSHLVPSCFEQLPDAPFVTHYRGDRLVTLQLQDSAGVPTTLEYLEEVAADGNGAYTIQPLQVIAPGMTFAEEADFLQRQAAREGFFYRYRGFQIHDWAGFQQHYEVLDPGQNELVAGVPCRVFEVRSRDGSGPRHRLSVDPQTSLVLSEEVLAEGGALLRSFRFQTFQLGADLSDLTLDGGSSSWTTTDLPGLEQALQGDLLQPTAPPAGHELVSVAWRPATAAPSVQGTWAQLVFGDGVESVFFLYEDSTIPSGSSPATYNAGLEGDLVRVHTSGGWTLVEGLVRSRRVILVGRAHEQELLLMLQSAVE